MRTLPPDSRLAALRRAGRTYAEIAADYGVSETAVWKALRRARLTGQPTRYAELIPWQVRPEHANAHALVMLRALCRDPETLPAQIAGKLIGWKYARKQTGTVVAYSPETGFSYVPRQEGDTEWIRKP